MLVRVFRQLQGEYAGDCKAAAGAQDRTKTEPLARKTLVLCCVVRYTLVFKYKGDILEVLLIVLLWYTLYYKTVVVVVLLMDLNSKQPVCGNCVVRNGM